MNPTVAPVRPAVAGDLLALREVLSGQVSCPLDPDWDDARAAWALAVDQRPALVVRPADVRDVQLAIQYAVRHGLRVAAQGTGHNAAPLGSLAGTMLVRTDLMRGIRVDPVTMTARVEAGVQWAEVSAAAAEHGLAALAGSSPDVGVVGYTLGGGVSWFARSHGLSVNSVTAVELVTPDGVLRRADETSEPELFWAVRGGGGAFGVVTALEFRLYPIATVHSGALFWPLERAADVLHAWRDWCDELPASVMTAARVMRFPPLPDLPEPLRGRSFAIVEAVFQDPAAVADAILADLRALGPEMDTFRTTPVPELSALHMDPPGPVPGVGHGALIRELSAEAVEAFLSVVDTPAGEVLLSAEFRLLGAALAPGRSEGGAVSALDGEYLLFAGGMAPTREAGGAVNAALDDLLSALAPWRSGADYLNFAERPVEAERLFTGNLERLRTVARHVDPEGRMHSNHPLDG